VIRRRANGADGPVLQAAFFLGPGEFYRALRELPEDERRLFEMTSVARVNDLYGEESLNRRQRRDARFINICMKATLSGAAVSDGLEDGRVVSGVGGQFNFVAMAHELEGARSILLLRASHESQSNIVFSYGHQTIPRHLRDIVVTQYGIADLRGRTDAEVAAALIAIADRRFQDRLAARAKAAGKLARDWRVPQHALGNTEERLAERLAPLARRGLLPLFPLGTDFDSEEQRLVAALLWLKSNFSMLGIAAAPPPRPGDLPALARMGLDKPRSLRERLLRRIVTLGLRRVG
jgi:acyl-CoA hydrolase